jgi:type I restriction enzyme S subunit
MAGEKTTKSAEIGKVPADWDVGQLNLFTSRITYGFTNPMPTTDEGPFMLTAKDVNGGRIVYENARRTSWDAFRNELTDKSRPRVGDVLLTKDGSIGRVALCDRPDVCINQSVALLQPNERIEPRFLKFLLEVPHYQQRMEGDADGTTIKHIYITRVDKMQVAVPPIAEQKAIASVLGALDDKIELNRRMNATLEGMARALFQSWFVDFDPVRAKLDGRKPEGMDKATAALFPDGFQESSLGPVPMGWRTCTLGDIAKNFSITFDFMRVSDVVFINTGDVLEGDFLHSKRSAHAGLPGQAKKSIRPEDILFSEIRPANKRYAYVDFDASDYVVSTKFMIIHGSKEIHPRLLYRILTAKETLDEFQVQAESRSGTFPQITFDSISHLPIVLPPIGIQEAFQRYVEKMDAQIKVNKQQSHTLATLRDTLLPKLLSGELSVASILKAKT